MTKISKTIKKLRIANGLTQNALAEKLFVTRQTVSSWETGRTQPDIETLTKLAEVFGATAEEIIYGEIKNPDPKAEKEKSRKFITVIFAVIASLLVGSGFLIIFITGWEEFPVPLKTIFAFVPILLGQSAALYTYIKKRESVAWREGASVLLCAGIAGTVAMVDSIYDLSPGFGDCMLIDALLILPIIYIFDAAVPLIFYYVSSIYFGIEIMENFRFEFDFFTAYIVTTILLMLGFGYVFMNREKKNDARHIYTVWISAAAATVTTVLFMLFSDLSVVVTVGIITVFFIGMYVFDKNVCKYYPFEIMGTLGIAGASVAEVFISNPENYSSDYNYGKTEFLYMLIPILFTVSVIIFVIARRGFFKGDFPKTLVVVCAFLCSFTEIISYFTNSMGKEYVFVILFALTFAQAIALIVKGALLFKFVTLNIGLLLIAVLTAYILIGLNIEALYMGALFILLGVVLFIVNFFISRKAKKIREADRNA